MGRVERPAKESDPARSRRKLGAVHGPMLPVGQRLAAVTTAPYIAPDLRRRRIFGPRGGLCNLRMTEVTMTGLYSTLPMWLNIYRRDHRKHPPIAPETRLPPEIIPSLARVMRLSEAKTSE